MNENSVDWHFDRKVDWTPDNQLQFFDDDYLISLRFNEFELYLLLHPKAIYFEEFLG